MLSCTYRILISGPLLEPGQGTSHSNDKTLGLYTFCTQRAYEGRRTMTFLKFAVGNSSGLTMAADSLA